MQGSISTKSWRNPTEGMCEGRTYYKVLTFCVMSDGHQWLGNVYLRRGRTFVCWTIAGAS